MKNKRADENIYKFTNQHWKDKGYKNCHYFNVICRLRSVKQKAALLSYKNKMNTIQIRSGQVNPSL